LLLHLFQVLAEFRWIESALLRATLQPALDRFHGLPIGRNTRRKI